MHKYMNRQDDCSRACRCDAQNCRELFECTNCMIDERWKFHRRTTKRHRQRRKIGEIDERWKFHRRTTKGHRQRRKIAHRSRTIRGSDPGSSTSAPRKEGAIRDREMTLKRARGQRTARGQRMSQNWRPSGPETRHGAQRDSAEPQTQNSLGTRLFIISACFLERNAQKQMEHRMSMGCGLLWSHCLVAYRGLVLTNLAPRKVKNG